MKALINISRLLGLMSLLLVVYSCGSADSSKFASKDYDGIYDNGFVFEEDVVVDTEQTIKPNYFALEYERIKDYDPSQDILVDIESYSSPYEDQYVDIDSIQSDYAFAEPWAYDNGSSVEINYYGTNSFGPAPFGWNYNLYSMPLYMRPYGNPYYWNIGYMNYGPWAPIPNIYWGPGGGIYAPYPYYYGPYSRGRYNYPYYSAGRGWNDVYYGRKGYSNSRPASAGRNKVAKSSSYRGNKYYGQSRVVASSKKQVSRNSKYSRSASVTNRNSRNTKARSSSYKRSSANYKRDSSKSSNTNYKSSSSRTRNSGYTPRTSRSNSSSSSRGTVSGRSSSSSGARGGRGGRGN
ncbi:MAG: hypothetical protein ACPGR7_03840 [Flavobacteriaceae bacterium]